jgi:hypothetical protein
MKSAKRNIRAVANEKRRKRRDELITIVNNGIRDVGKALIELRDDEHWKDTHNSFSDFCKDNFKISKTYLYDVIKGMEVIASLPKDVRSKITNEGQARALAKLPESKRVGAILSAEKNGGITAESLLSHAAKPTAKPVPPKSAIADSTFPEKSEPQTSSKHKSTLKEKPKVWLDENNYPIPDDALPWWEKAWGEEHEDDLKVQDVLSKISDLKSIVVGGREKREFRWLKVTNSIADTFDSLRSLISEAKPYAVCTTCMGSPSLQSEGCNFCKNTGLISKWQWDTQSRKEIKDMMLRRAADLKKERENVH